MAFTLSSHCVEGFGREKGNPRSPERFIMEQPPGTTSTALIRKFLHTPFSCLLAASYPETQTLQRNKNHQLCSSAHRATHPKKLIWPRRVNHAVNFESEGHFTSLGTDLKQPNKVATELRSPNPSPDIPVNCKKHGTRSVENLNLAIPQIVKTWNGHHFALFSRPGNANSPCHS